MSVRKRMKKWFAVLLACILFLMTGCDSIVKNAKPPKQYLASQVLDGNFVDFSDPEAVAALYKEHYDSLKNNKEYKAYSALRGGIDLFKVPSNWSKNFLNFQIVGYDTEKDLMIYSYQTTFFEENENQYEYSAEAEVETDPDTGDIKKDDAGNPVVSSDVLQTRMDTPGLIAAVGVYDRKLDVNKLFFTDEDRDASRDNAGNGLYSLLVTYENDTIAILYRNQVTTYPYDKKQKTFVKDGGEQYDLRQIFQSMSFVKSLRSSSRYTVSPITTPNESNQIYLRYQITPSKDQVMTLEDQNAIAAFMEEVENGLLQSDVGKTYSDALRRNQYYITSDTLSKALKDISKTVDLTLRKLEGKNRPVGGTSIRDNYMSNFQSYDNTFWLLNSYRLRNASTISFFTPKLSQVKDMFLPWSYKISIQEDNTQRDAYQVDCQLHFCSRETGYSKVDWGTYQFTIHNILYKKTQFGNMVPCWFQAEYSDSSPSKPVEPADTVTASNLQTVLGGMEKQAEENASEGGGIKWLEVTLNATEVKTSQLMSVTSTKEIKSQADIDSLMQAEKSRIREETVKQNAEFLRWQPDVTRVITKDNLEDLQAEITRCEQELEAEAEAAAKAESEAAEKKKLGINVNLPPVVKVAKAPGEDLSAAFTPADQTVTADKQLTVEEGPGLLAALQYIYEDQEKIREQTVFAENREAIRDNTAYDQLLNLMELKFDELQQGRPEAENTARKEALARLLAERKPDMDSGQTETKEPEWETLAADSQDNPETNLLAEYLQKNQVQLQNELTQTRSDLELLSDLALQASGQTKSMATLNSGGKKEDAKDIAETSNNLYRFGFEAVVTAYQRAEEAFLRSSQGLSDIGNHREDLELLQSENIQISRFDLNVSDKKLEFRLGQCDRMGQLMLTLIGGSADADREAALQELERTNWKIAVTPEFLEKKLVIKQVEAVRQTYEDVVWTSNAYNWADTDPDYYFSDGYLNLSLGESVSDSESTFIPKGTTINGTVFPEKKNVENIGRFLSLPSDSVSNLMRNLQSCTATRVMDEDALHKSFGLMDMDQAVHATIHWKPTEIKTTGLGFWRREEVISKKGIRVTTGTYSVNLDRSIIELELLSQTEAKAPFSQPRWSLFTVPYDSKDKLFNAEGNTQTYAYGTYSGINDAISYTKTVTDYYTIYENTIQEDAAKADAAKEDATKEDATREIATRSDAAKGEEKELSPEELQQKIEDREQKKDETEIAYEVKLRNMLSEYTTIFLDNPVLRISNLKKSNRLTWSATWDDASIFYFLNISLDEGIQLYAIDLKTNKIIRQLEFADQTLKPYVNGCFFRGWWIPDGKTEYNAEGNLSGGKLILLGLTQEDMKQYSSKEETAVAKPPVIAGQDSATADPEAVAAMKESAEAALDAPAEAELTESEKAVKEEASNLRQLVNDDIFHSRMYEVTITAAQMNACKITK